MKPILFNTEMVQAIKDGRKTVTRRLVKFKAGQNPQWSGYVPDGPVLYGSHNIPAVKAPYKPGDFLYVRETWQKYRVRKPQRAVPHDFNETQYLYRADGEVANSDGSPFVWRPSIHMPKEAARIFLRVKDVRVERLQDITDESAKAEGVRGFWLGMGESGYAVSADSKTFYDGPVGAFANLWNSTIKPTDLDTYGWDANPWVWVIDFEKISKEET